MLLHQKFLEINSPTLRLYIYYLLYTTFTFTLSRPSSFTCLSYPPTHDSSFPFPHPFPPLPFPRPFPSSLPFLLSLSPTTNLAPIPSPPSTTTTNYQQPTKHKLPYHHTKRSYQKNQFTSSPSQSIKSPWPSPPSRIQVDQNSNSLVHGISTKQRRFVSVIELMKSFGYVLNRVLVLLVFYLSGF